MPQAAMTMQRRLDRYDAYWYAHQQRALPVLRAGFEDAAQTWFHIDPRAARFWAAPIPAGAAIAGCSTRCTAWISRGLPAWRPAWDVVVWLLSLPGLTISVSGIVIGWRRLVR
jgi:hypothetical protein